jgi:hypothetical protein
MAFSVGDEVLLDVTVTAGTEILTDGDTRTWALRNHRTRPVRILSFSGDTVEVEFLDALGPAFGPDGFYPTRFLRPPV